MRTLPGSAPGRSVRPASAVVTSSRFPNRSAAPRASAAPSAVPPRISRRFGAVWTRSSMLPPPEYSARGRVEATGYRLVFLTIGAGQQVTLTVKHRDIDSGGAGQRRQRGLAASLGDASREARAKLGREHRHHLADAFGRSRGTDGPLWRAELR